MDICIVAGARPDFIKAAPIIRAVGKVDDISYKLVYTGEENSPHVEPSLFRDLQIPPRVECLGVGGDKLNEVAGGVMARLDAFLDSSPSDVLIVVNDLAATMAAAIVAKRRGMKLAHLVAGTRSFDMNMPKEVNRLVIDGLSDYLFTAGESGNSIAGKEGVDPSKVFYVGNILIDTLRQSLPLARKPVFQGADGLQKGGYVLLTLNRNALLSDGETLRTAMAALLGGVGGKPVVAALRPQAEAKLKAALAGGASNVLFTGPLPYLEFCHLTANAAGIVTDSGNVAEEATFLGVPCMTLNDYAELQETVKVGTNVLVGTDPSAISEAAADMVAGRWKGSALPDRWDGRTAERIVSILAED